MGRSHWPLQRDVPYILGVVLPVRALSPLGGSGGLERQASVGRHAQHVGIANRPIVQALI